MLNHASEIQFVEKFALADDRDQVLKELIPGTETYYYFHCLHYQNQEKFDQVDELLKSWIKRYNQTPAVTEIQNRQALLTYERNPQKSLARIQDQLGLRFDHVPPRLTNDPQLPTFVDEKLISRKSLTKREFDRRQDLGGFQISAMRWLAEVDLNPIQRRDLLSRLERPDVAHLASLVAKDLNYKGSSGFGSLPIHQRLLLEQLDELLAARPILKNEQQFVETYLVRLRPNNDVDVRHNDDEYLAYLNRLWQFVSQLDPAQNSLKAHVLYHRLVFDERQGKRSEARFLEYVKLPRPTRYMNREFMANPESQRFTAILDQNYSGTTMPAIRDDEPLVNRYLRAFFVKSTNYKQYAPYMDDTYLKELFAETKIVNGLGDPEQWYSMLPPEKYQLLKERVDLDFAETNATSFEADETVGLDLDIKNAKSLLVKIYEINTQNYYRQYKTEIETDINLDGLVPNHQLTFEYDEPPTRKMRRHFELAQLSKPGVYVVDFIGNGKSSRALIRKGQLSVLERLTAGGHVFTILDDKDQKVDDATIWVADREYTPNNEGNFLVPFATKATKEAMVITRDDTSSLHHFDHQTEIYSLTAAIHVEQESLIARATATVIIRPMMFVNDVPISPGVLTDTSLTISSVDLDGIESSTTIDNFSMRAADEAVHDFTVPARLSSIRFTISGKVKVPSTGKTETHTSSRAFDVNGIDRTDQLEDLHFSKHATGYVVELLGKSGEPKANRAVRVEITHRDFNEPTVVNLQTDAKGMATLGDLNEIRTVKAVATNAQGSGKSERVWHLINDGHSNLAIIHAEEGKTISIPFFAHETNRDQPSSTIEDGEKEKLRDFGVSLLEMRHQAFYKDRSQHAKIDNGFLRISQLPIGDYNLRLGPDAPVSVIRVSKGGVDDHYVLGNRRLELRGQKRLQIESIREENGSLIVQLANANEFSRVHVFATRFVPSGNAFHEFLKVDDMQPNASRRPYRGSLFVEGRDIGDEYRYILDRQSAKKFVGNMLQRPNLLLNPWDIRDTKTGTRDAASGDDFARVTEDAPAAMSNSAAAESLSRQQQIHSTSVNFLAKGGITLANLKPDAQGRIQIDRDRLNGCQHIHVLAIGPLETTYRSSILDNAETPFRDLRLVDGLEPKQHFTQQQSVSVLAVGDKFEVHDITTAQIERFETLADAYNLLLTVSKNPTLREFEFVLRWPKLTDEEKLELYGKYACHELHFFLYQKDREFFKKVVEPYLSNKRDKTFMDHWLLEADLSAYLSSWRFQQLNAVERILLSNRIAGERESIQRHINELAEFVTRDREIWDRLFQTALQRQELSERDELQSAISGRKRSLQQSASSRAENRLHFFKEKMSNVESEDSVSRGAMMKSKKGVQSKRPSRGRGLGENADFYAADGGIVEFGASFGVSGQLGRRFFQSLEKTKEWVENNYYRLPITSQNADLITVTEFWNDFAKHQAQDGPFLSEHWPLANRNFSENMLALAVLELPFEATAPNLAFDESTKMTLTVQGPMMIFHQTISTSEAPADETAILVSQNFFRHDDRFETKGGRRTDKFVTDEFLAHTAYGCQIVITNPSSTERDIDVLMQIPVGAMPIQGAKETRTARISLAPFQTHRLEYLFYFPAPGQFKHFPVHVSSDKQLAVAAKPITFNVVEQATQVDRSSWNFVSSFGSDDEVLAYLNENSVQGIALNRIAFRMKNRDTFRSVVDLLKKRHVYDSTLWSYSINHNSPNHIREYLAHTDSFTEQCGAWIDSRLLTVDPVLRRNYEHMEYWPLVNARAHQLGVRRQILNDRFHEQYHRYMNILACRRQLDDSDLMGVTYYMTLQDRIAEARSHFEQVRGNQLATRLQYDYFAAYLDLFDADTRLARSIAMNYVNHPVPRWRTAFESLQATLDEIDGKPHRLVDGDDRDQRQTDLAGSEPSFEFKVNDQQVELRHQNLDEVTINYYLMDLELLFSRNPFVQSYGGQFAHIRPNLTTALSLAVEESTTTFELPSELQNRNVLIEISAAGKTKTQPYYSNSLAFQVIENYGQVKISDEKSGKPIPMVYVKVYAQMTDGSVRFYKDGYTDLRGRFDYASLSTNELDNVQRFSLLAISDENGAVVREAAPPKR